VKKIIYFFFLFSNFCFSQNWIKANYSYIDIGNDNDTIKSVLLTNGEESVFRLYDKRKNGITHTSNGPKIIHTDSLSNFSYSNQDKTFSRIIVFGQEFVYSDSTTKKIVWSLTKKTKKIGAYNCQQAKTKLNGRGYTVWYTTKIPMSMGPLKLNGLPGLIVEVSDDDKIKLKIILNSLTSIEEKKEFEFCKNYVTQNKKLMTYNDYCDKMIDAMVYRKNKFYAAGAEKNVTFHFAKGAFAVYMIDIPENLEKKLDEVHD
jgi:GLPGLI family protein